MSEFVYWEQQDGSMCAVHALNTLIQYPYWDAFSLAEVAAELDLEEKRLSTSWNMRSQNVREDGFFSVQAIARALQRHSLELDYLRSDVNYNSFQAFIFNHDLHWFTLRKKCGTWYNLNSISSGPRIITEFNLSAMIGSLKDQGFTVFFISGSFPYLGRPGLLEKNQYVFSIPQVKLMQEERVRVRKAEESDLQEALKRSMQDHIQISNESFPLHSSNQKSFSQTTSFSSPSNRNSHSTFSETWENPKPSRYEELFSCQLSEEEQLKLVIEMSKNEM
jgi:ataxin-3